MSTCGLGVETPATARAAPELSAGQQLVLVLFEVLCSIQGLGDDGINQV